jgi:hypothetical protein
MKNDPKNRNKNRYLKLNGDPIHLPMLLGIWKNRDTQVVGLTAAFTTAAAWYTGTPTPQLASMGMDAALAFTTYQVLDRLFRGIDFKRLFNGKAHVCIDRKPNGFAPPTSAKDLRAAGEMRNRAISSMLFLGILTPLLYFDDFRSLATTVTGGTLEDPARNGMFSSIFWLTWMARDTLTALRFHKVEKKDWTIVDTPAKKQKEESWLGKLMPGGN